MTNFTAQNKAGAHHQGPQRWESRLFLAFGAAQLIAGAVFFFAFNWRDLPDPVKIALPQATMVFGFFIWAILGRASRLGAVFGLLATVMIGVSMGVVGQVYQLGADPWRLFAIWAAFALPLSMITRSDAQFALWFAIATIAWFLFAGQAWLPDPAWAEPETITAALFTLAATAVLFIRERMADGASRWLRWVMAATALFAALAGSLREVIDGQHILAEGVVATIALFATAGILFTGYRLWRPDKPVQAMAMFGLAAWVGVLGVRFVFTVMRPDSLGEIALSLFLSAGWVAGVTVALATGFRRFLKDDASSARAAS